MASFAEPVVSFLLENISKLLIEEAQFLSGVSEQAQQLQSKLRLLLSLLRDADSKQDQDSLLQEWISQSKDVAYDAENVLEDFAFKVASRRGKGKITDMLMRYSCIVSEFHMRHKAGSEIQNLHSRISDVTDSFYKYGIRNTMEKEGSSSRHQQLIRRTYSHVEEDDFVGLGNDVELLVQKLTNDAYNVVSICGMGGLGKTTIARKVHNHPTVRHHFHAFAWVCISQQWQTKDILQGILIKTSPERREEILKYREDELPGKLCRILEDRKCLIVVDDIWSTDAWECMKYAFPSRDRSKSTILLTTRNESVAIRIDPNGFRHKPRFLDDDESWELLKKKALRDALGQGLEDIGEFKELGKEMAKSCRGLPLAVVVLGGILATKCELNEWRFVYKNIKSFLEKGDGEIGEKGEVKSVQKILALSYNDLPFHLKPCFLYLSIFPEDDEIETERLYQLWMAEGMVSEGHQRGGESMMDVADRYLGELVKRCMIQVSLNAKEGPALRKFKSCSLHDLMRDLCLAKARDENFVKVVDYRQGNNPELVDSNSSTTKCHRCLVLFNKQDRLKYLPPKRQGYEHIRSLIVRRLGEVEDTGPLPSNRFNKLKMLRALTIQGFHQISTEELCDFINDIIQLFKLEIGNLIHLRYLCLWESSFFMLPSSLGNLVHLETLDLRKCGIDLLMNVITKLKHLRYLYFPGGTYVMGTNSWLSKVRLFDLTQLEVLENITAERCEFKDLRTLRNLQVLKVKVWDEEEFEEIAHFTSISPCLKLLTLKVPHNFGFTSERHPSLLDKLFGSHLSHLKLKGYLQVFPEYQSYFFRNLVELELVDSRIKVNLMETLEKLPNLQSLWLRTLAFYGTEMTCSSLGFPQLKFLLLDVLYPLSEWRVENGAMPNLSCLQILECRNLKMIPDGLRFLTKLKELEIRNMPESFCDRIRTKNGKEGEDFDKVRHVPVLVITAAYSDLSEYSYIYAFPTLFEQTPTCP